MHGQYDQPLNETGIKQAQSAGQAMKNLSFDKAHSSDLKRALKTCQSVLEANQSSEIKVEDIICHEVLRERSFGIHECVTLEDWQKMAKEADVEEYDFRPQGGENTVDVTARARKFLEVCM